MVSEKIFGDIFIRILLMLFPAMMIVSKSIYEAMLSIVCIFFTTLLNTQYFAKIKTSDIDKKEKTKSGSAL